MFEREIINDGLQQRVTVHVMVTMKSQIISTSRSPGIGHVDNHQRCVLYNQLSFGSNSAETTVI